MLNLLKQFSSINLKVLFIPAANVLALEGQRHSISIFCCLFFLSLLCPVLHFASPKSCIPIRPHNLLYYMLHVFIFPFEFLLGQDRSWESPDSQEMQLTRRNLSVPTFTVGSDAEAKFRILWPNDVRIYLFGPKWRKNLLIWKTKMPKD